MYRAKPALLPLCYAATVCLLGNSGGLLMAQRTAQFQGHWEVVDLKPGSFSGRLLTKDGLAITATCGPSRLAFEITSTTARFRRVDRPALRVAGIPFSLGPAVVISATINGHSSELPGSSPDSYNVSLILTKLRTDFTSEQERRKTPFQQGLDRDAMLWTIDSVFEAQSIQFKLPLTNGEEVPIDINPQERSFQQFASRCAPLVRPRPISDRPAIVHFNTADEFATAFPELLRQASMNAGVEPQKYEKESRFVVNAVKTCAELTIPMARNIEGTNPNGLPMQGDGGKYAVCYQGVELVSKKVNSPGRPGEREITLLVSAGPKNWRTPAKSWSEGDQLSVNVFYTPINPKNDMNMAEPGTVPIVVAKIDRAK